MLQILSHPFMASSSWTEAYLDSFVLTHLHLPGLYGDWCDHQARIASTGVNFLHKNCAGIGD